VKAVKTLLLVAFAAGLLATSAQASIYVDLTGMGGTAIELPSAAFEPTAVNVAFQLYIRVTPSATPTGDSIQKALMVTKSTNVGGGLINGILWAEFVSGGPFSLHPTNSTVGKSQDIDGDSISGAIDKDLGMITGGSPNDNMSAYSTVYNVQPDATGFDVYSMTFTGTGLTSANPHGVTVLQGAFTGALGKTMWKEGGVSKTALADQKTGTTITLYRADDAKLDHAVLSLDGTASVKLDGAESIGSINMWSWDVNGDGNFEVASALATSLELRYDPITGVLSWEGPVGSGITGSQALSAGNYPVKLQTKWLGSTLTSDETTSMMTLLPEPATMALLGLGGLALAIRRRRNA